MLVKFKTTALYKCGKEVRVNPDTVSFLIASSDGSTQIVFNNGEKASVVENINSVEEKLFPQAIAAKASEEQIKQFNEDLARAGGKRSTAALEQVPPAEEDSSRSPSALFIDDTGIKPQGGGKPRGKHKPEDDNP